MNSILRGLLRRSDAVRPAGRRARRTRCSHEPLERRCLLSFSPAAGYPVGANPQDVVTADFNNDGRLDLAVANYSGDTVSVLLGNGDATFQPAQTSPTGAGPQSVAVGDFNEDGTLDLATANAASVSVLTGNGDGTFGSPADINVGSDPASVAVGDFNGDGRMDLGVVSNTFYYWPEYGYGDYQGIANVLLGHGDGTFAGPNTTWISWGYNRAAVAADFNGDAVDDLAVTADYGYVSVLTGDAGGFLQGPATFAVSYSPSSVDAGDFDGDGDADLVASTLYDTNAVSVLLNDGAGGFAAARNYPAGSGPTSVVVGDLDHDGFADLATANPGGNTVGVLRGRGDGSFAPVEIFAAGQGPGSIAAGDFNGDGWLDLAAASGSADSVSVLMNDRAWPPAPASLSVNDVVVIEGNSGTTAAVFTVTRGGSTAGTATVNYATANAGAAAGSDYSAESGTLTFAAGVGTLQVTVPVNGDLTDEYDQAFTFNLSAASGAVITDGQGFGTIVDDDDAPTVRITPRVSAREGNKNQSSLFGFTVTLSAASEKDVWVSYATADGTATAADGDYVAQSGGLSFAPGVTSRTVYVRVFGDMKKEANETFFVNLTGVSNATILQGQGPGFGENLNDATRCHPRAGGPARRRFAAGGASRRAGAARTGRVPLHPERPVRRRARGAGGVTACQHLPGEQAAGRQGDGRGALDAGAQLRPPHGTGGRRRAAGDGLPRPGLGVPRRAAHRPAGRAARTSRRLLPAARRTRHGGHRRPRAGVGGRGAVGRQHPLLLPLHAGPRLQLRAAVAAAVRHRPRRRRPLPPQRAGGGGRPAQVRDRTGRERHRQRLAGQQGPRRLSDGGGRRAGHCPRPVDAALAALARRPAVAAGVGDGAAPADRPRDRPRGARDRVAGFRPRPGPGRPLRLRRPFQNPPDVGNGRRAAGTAPGPAHVRRGRGGSAARARHRHARVSDGGGGGL
jgi:hypothetical protein